MPAVVADSSPLVYLSRLGRLELLRELHGEVLIPPAVWREVAEEGAELIEGKLVRQESQRGWIKVATDLGNGIQDPQMEALDEGERDAIALAISRNALLIIDELQGRAVAKRLGLTITGTLGILVEARLRGLIEKLGPELERLIETTNFYCAPDLLKTALAAAGEGTS